MAAAATDKFRKKKNLFATTLNGGISDVDVTLTANSLTGVPTDTGVTVTIDRVDSNGIATPALREDITGVVSGSNITGLLRAQSGTTAVSHANGAVVEMTWDSETWNDAVDGFLADHEQDGTHSASIALTTPALTSPTFLGNIDGWIAGSDTWTYASATTFTIAGVDRTALFKKGTKLKLTQTSAKYFYVTSSSFSTNTTVTVTGGSDYTLANAAITSPYYSYASNPQAFPHWFNWSPTVDWDSTDPSGTTTTITRFRVEGDTCYIEFRQNNTVAGTTNTQVGFNGPIASQNISNTYLVIGAGMASTAEIDTRPTTSAIAFIYSTTPVIYVFFSSISAKSAYCSGSYRI